MEEIHERAIVENLLGPGIDDPDLLQPISVKKHIIIKGIPETEQNKICC